MRPSVVIPITNSTAEQEIQKYKNTTSKVQNSLIQYTYCLSVGQSYQLAWDLKMIKCKKMQIGANTNCQTGHSGE